MAQGFSPLLPLQRSDEDGYYALTKTIASNTKQNLKNLLLTSPGERVMIPDFGVGLKHFLFKNVHESLESDLSSRIHEQVEKYLPYIRIENVEFTRHEPQYETAQTQNRLDIQIYYSVPEFNFSDMFKFTEVQFI